MTTTEYELTEQERKDCIAEAESRLKAVDRQSTQITNALRHVRALRFAATELDSIPVRSLTVETYDHEEWWDPERTDLELAASVQALLAGSFKEPVRDLIAATHAAEAALVAAGAHGEEARGQYERELKDLTNG